MAKTSTTPYIGRFAPSPSGPLHMGSLLCALASFLDARAHQGKWLVRIEDIDPPREIAGADRDILKTLVDHGLQWDDSVMYQSSRAKAYEETLAKLQQEGLAYRCDCTRKRLATLNHNYDNACRQRQLTTSTAAAIRLNTEAARAKIARNEGHITKAKSEAEQIDSRIRFNDEIQGISGEDFEETGDFVIHRKDGLFAYQLAVVVDDITQGITHIVRGSDLLDTTAKQILLTQTIGHAPPKYSHIPILATNNGLKLSKQNHAPAVESNNASHNLLRCLRYLNQIPPDTLNGATHSTILEWAIKHWNKANIPNCLSVIQ